MALISWIWGKLTGHDEPRRAKHFDLLALPGELRNEIYRYTLTTDPLKLEREHKYNCKWCTWTPGEPQRRMFKTSWHDTNEKLPDCRCWAREGLSLLLASRQIHAEAAPILWAENNFSFPDIDSFHPLDRWALRREYRPLIRHITLYFDEYSRADKMPIMLHDKVMAWQGPEPLERPASQVFNPVWTRPDACNIIFGASLRFTGDLPNLETFSWIDVHDVYDIQASMFCVGGLAYPCRMTKCMDVAAMAPEQFRAYGPLNRDMGEKVVRRICRGAIPGNPGTGIAELLERAGRRNPADGGVLVSTGRPFEYRCAGGTTGRTRDDKGTGEVVREGGLPMTWTLKVRLMPLSPETIARNARLKARDEELNKARQRGSPGLGTGSYWTSLARDMIYSGLGRRTGTSRLGFR